MDALSAFLIPTFVAFMRVEIARLEALDKWKRQGVMYYKERIIPMVGEPFYGLPFSDWKAWRQEVDRPVLTKKQQRRKRRKQRNNNRLILGSA